MDCDSYSMHVVFLKINQRSHDLLEEKSSFMFERNFNLVDVEVWPNVDGSG